MKVSWKKVGIALTGLVLVCAGLLFFLQNRLERISTDYLENKLPGHIQLKYEELDVNILTASLRLKMITADYFDPRSRAHRNAMIMDELHVDGLDYWEYFINDRMVLDKVILSKPHIVHYADTTEQESKKKKDESPDTDWLLKEVRVENGSFAMVPDGKSGPVLTFQNVQALAINCTAKKGNAGEKVPFDIHSFTFSATDFYSELGEFERMEISGLDYKDERLEVSDFSIKTRFGKKELSEKIETERDHTSLVIQHIVVNRPTLGYKDSVLHLGADSVRVQRPVAEIFRDKLVADNQKHKPMYSQMLREMPFKLNIPKLSITEGELLYEERVKQGSGAGTLTFENLSAQLVNISNTYEPPLKTEIKAEALFMKDSPIELDWSFDINNAEELFTVSGIISDFNAPSINPYLESTMNYRVDGYVRKLYFTASGNMAQSKGDLEMNYTDFDFVVLKEDGSGVNTFMTVIGDILVKGNKNNPDPGFRYGHIEAERDPTKSFFNYLWLNVRSGIKSSVTGDGEKD